MYKLRLLLIGIACSCAAARNMERREDHHLHHPLASTKSTLEHSNSIHAVTDIPAGQREAVEKQSSTSTQSTDVAIENLLWVLKEFQKARRGNASLLHDQPIVKTSTV